MVKRRMSNLESNQQKWSSTKLSSAKTSQLSSEDVDQQITPNASHIHNIQKSQVILNYILCSIHASMYKGFSVLPISQESR